MVHLVQDWRLALDDVPKVLDGLVHFQLEQRLDLVASGLEAMVREPIIPEFPPAGSTDSSVRCKGCGLPAPALTCDVGLSEFPPFRFHVCDLCLIRLAESVADVFDPEVRRGVADRLRARAESDAPKQPSHDPYWRPDLWGPLDPATDADHRIWLSTAEEGGRDDPSPLARAEGSQYFFTPWAFYRGQWFW